jgi:hypothetical protein
VRPYLKKQKRERIFDMVGFTEFQKKKIFPERIMSKQYLMLER